MEQELRDIEILLTEELTKKLELKNKLKEKELEKQDVMKDFFLGIINIIDSIESKEENLTQKYSQNEIANKVIKSFSSIKKQLINLLSKHGVTQINFLEGKLIIGFSKVIETEPDPTKKNDTIVSIIKNGYIRGSELIREAELIVVKN
jgi:molecular chaperone GrpE (heat shock protein)